MSFLRLIPELLIFALMLRPLPAEIRVSHFDGVVGAWWSSFSMVLATAFFIFPV
jgi:hypothetical protein